MATLLHEWVNITTRQQTLNCWLRVVYIHNCSLNTKYAMQMHNLYCIYMQWQHVHALLQEVSVNEKTESGYSVLSSILTCTCNSLVLTSGINWQQIHKVYILAQHSRITLLHTFDGQGHSEVDKYTHKNHHLQQPLDHCSTVCVAGYFVKSCKCASTFIVINLGNLSQVCKHFRQEL